MPYLQYGRETLAPHSERKATQGGELNYQITCLLDNFITMKGLSYAAINEAIGAIESAKLEFYRRVAAPYEDKKCRENGEVYLNV